MSLRVRQTYVLEDSAWAADERKNGVVAGGCDVGLTAQALPLFGHSFLAVRSSRLRFPLPSHDKDT